VVDPKAIFGRLPSYPKLDGSKLRYLRNFHVAHMRDGIIRMVNHLQAHTPSASPKSSQR
jgi:hypothetical protein